MKYVWLFSVLLAVFIADEPPSSIIHRSGVTDVPSVAKALIAYPIRCGDGGQMFFRMYKAGDPMGAPVIEVERDATAVARTFDFQSVRDSSIEKPEFLKVLDFHVLGSTLYAIGLDGKSNPVVLKFSVDDASYLGSVVMEKGFFPQRFAVFDSGAMVLTGLLTHPDANGKNKTENVTEEYGPDGRFQSYLHIIGDFSFAGPTPAPEELRMITATQMSAAGSNIYLIRPGSETSVFVIPEAGGKIERHTLWSPGADWSIFSLLVSGDRALIGYVHDLEKDGSKSSYVQYSLSSFEPVGQFYLASDVAGAFGCTDWKGNYSFVTTQNKHLAILNAR